MNKNAVAFELTKLIASEIVRSERNSEGDTDYPKALAEAYNKIFATIKADK
ncbi:MAG: hypothetical protein NSGCLCUN01_03515 [uncultured Clostridium sp.]